MEKRVSFIKNKKIISVLLCVIMIFGLNLSVSSAKAFKVTPSRSYTSAWEATAYATGSSKAYIHYITYGYNTTLINEDYTWAQCHVVSENEEHQAYVKNGNGTHKGSFVDHRFVSTIEVTHSGSSITYGCNVQNV